MVNTADSMIGHMTPEHAEFGRAAAKLDDVLNWIPARITALFIHLARYRRGNWDVVRRDAPLHRSPNAGWPEAAMAAALGVALSGPRSYHGTMSDEPWVNPDGAREIGPEEVDAGVATLWRAWGIGLACTALIALI
jgi:adenosylcobinamide-phosphate synthase